MNYDRHKSESERTELWAELIQMSREVARVCSSPPAVSWIEVPEERTKRTQELSATVRRIVHLAERIRQQEQPDSQERCLPPHLQRIRDDARKAVHEAVLKVREVEAAVETTKESMVVLLKQNSLHQQVLDAYGRS